MRAFGKILRRGGLALLAGGAIVAHAQTAAPAAAAAAPAAAAVPAAPPRVPTFSTLTAVPDGRLLAPDIARIVNRGELVVGMLDAETPPFFYTKDGEWIGIEVDLARAIAAELGVKVRFNRSAKTFNGVVDLLAYNQVDLVISKVSRTLARSQFISFSAPYLSLKHALMLNRVKFAQLTKDKAVSEVVRQFSGKIGVIAKSSYAYYAKRNFPRAEIVEYASWDEVLKALYKGDVVGAYRDEFEVKRILKIDPTASLLLRTITFKDLEDTLGIGVSINDPTLLAFINEFLAQRTDKLDINKVLAALER
ncbi:MAG: ABC transporter substrate-binding protein [Pseudomonadota bacterium]